MEVEVVVEKKPLEGRDPKTGQFVKGNKLRPPTAISPGRPKKLDSRIILEAIHDCFTPAEVSVMLRTAYNTALKTDDAKMQLEVVRFVAAYAIGKPVQRSINATIDKDEFVKLFSNDGGDEDGFIEADSERDV